MVHNILVALQNRDTFLRVLRVSKGHQQGVWPAGGTQESPVIMGKTIATPHCLGCEGQGLARVWSSNSGGSSSLSKVLTPSTSQPKGSGLHHEPWGWDGPNMEDWTFGRGWEATEAKSSKSS